jgi:hypothetical protein
MTTDYAFLLRDAHGSVRAVHETHVTGLFDRATWLTLLTEVGFSAERVVERDAGNRTPRDFFVGRR